MFAAKIFLHFVYFVAPPTKDVNWWSPDSGCPICYHINVKKCFTNTFATYLNKDMSEKTPHDSVKPFQPLSFSMFKFPLPVFIGIF